MKKQSIAIAVAGALALPALALAQTASVQIYGFVNAEYGFASQVDANATTSRHRVDSLGSGPSYFGFKGQESLGGGSTAWFQCESDLQFLGGTPRTSGSICDRNSAIGLKSGFGNFFVGTWDTPIKQAVAKTRMLNELGWLGVQNMLLGSPTNNFNFSNRNSDSINYTSPTFSGFTINAQTTSTKAAMNAASTVANVKGRDTGISADYVNGPLVVALAYMKRNQNRATFGLASAKDWAWSLGATYTYGPLKGGLTYIDKKFDDNVGGYKNKAWNLALQYQLSGPGSVLAGYTHVSKYVGDGGIDFVGSPDNGAKQWQIGYNHALSKRTNVGASYVRLDNNGNAVSSQFSLVPLTQVGGRAGDNASAFVLHMNHAF
ncbi:MAG: porin [Burkholderiales bacterium]